MKLIHRFSAEPLLELRSDYGSSDGRTVEGRLYVWFSSLEDGQLKKRMKAMPHLSVDEAMWFIGDNLEYLRTFSGQEDAVYQIHQLFHGCGFDVRANKGKPRKKTEVQVEPVVTQTVEEVACPAPAV